MSAFPYEPIRSIKAALQKSGHLPDCRKAIIEYLSALTVRAMREDGKASEPMNPVTMLWHPIMDRQRRDGSVAHLASQEDPSRPICGMKGHLGSGFEYASDIACEECPRCLEEYQKRRERIEPQASREG